MGSRENSYPCQRRVIQSLGFEPSLLPGGNFKVPGNSCCAAAALKPLNEARWPRKMPTPPPLRAYSARLFHTSSESGGGSNRHTALNSRKLSLPALAKRSSVHTNRCGALPPKSEGLSAFFQKQRIASGLPEKQDLRRGSYIFTVKNRWLSNSSGSLAASCTAP